MDMYVRKYYISIYRNNLSISGEVVDSNGSVIYQLIGEWDKGMKRYNEGMIWLSTLTPFN